MQNVCLCSTTEAKLLKKLSEKETELADLLREGKFFVLYLSEYLVQGIFM